jgi:TonB-dependent starch-binding outer membrane protein SusC
MKFKFYYLTKCLLLLLVALGMSSLAMAQRTISGTVTDAETGDPLIGANILVIGTSLGTITDIDGTYSLQVPTGTAEIEVSYTGFAAKRATLGVSNVVDVSLSAGSILDEVVVIGYGTAKKSDLTGSVSSLGEEDFNQGLVTSPDQLLQGRVAGVQLVNNSGQPGGNATVRIRGNSSIRAGNQPLFVIDGVQLTGTSSKPGTNTGDLGNSTSSNPLNYINPTDIESIQVLKDASATAIYGSRGANGVILITTKKGKSGDPSVNFSTSAGYSSILKKYDVLDGNEYRTALQQYDQTGGDYNDNVDAMDEILRNGFVQNHNVSISGGSSNGTYRASIGYYDQEGIVKSNDLRRITANLSGSYKFMDSKRFGIDYNLIASQTSENGPAVSTNAGFRGSLIGNALQWNPTHKLYEADGSPVIIPEFGNFTNPVALLKAYRDKSNTVDIIGSISPSYKITDNLTYRLDYSLTHGVGERRASIASWLNMQDVEDRGLASINEKNTSNQILTHSLSLNQDLTSDLSLQAVVGYEYQKRTEKNFGLFARDFIVEDFDYTNIFQNSSTDSRNASSGSPPDQELQSYFARTNFNYRDKYLLTASFRADGSSKFGSNNQYGYFPAFAFAWNLHNEDFLSGGTFDNLKLRLGWGKTGNSEFEAGASKDRWSFGLGSIQQENFPNPNLQWETTTNYNIGLDFAILDYKVTGTLEYFNRSSEDLLFNSNVIAPGPGDLLYWLNLPGKVVNSGVELTLNTQLVNNENLNWDLSANVSFLSNELRDYTGANLEYGQLFGQGISAATMMRLEDRQPLNAFYLSEFVEIGEDGQTVLANNGDKAYVGNPNPDVLLGVTSSWSVGNLSLILNFNGAFGHDIYNNTKNTVIPIGNLGTRNIDASLLTSANEEAISNPISPSSRYIEKGDYLKLANATLSYNLGNIGNTFKNAQIYLTGSNLFVITNYSGFDPEVNTVNQLDGLPSFGIEYIPYPTARTILLGANFSF